MISLCTRPSVGSLTFGTSPQSLDQVWQKSMRSMLMPPSQARCKQGAGEIHAMRLPRMPKRGHWAVIKLHGSSGRHASDDVLVALAGAASNTLNQLLHRWSVDPVNAHYAVFAPDVTCCVAQSAPLLYDTCNNSNKRVVMDIAWALPAACRDLRSHVSRSSRIPRHPTGSFGHPATSCTDVPRCTLGPQRANSAIFRTLSCNRTTTKTCEACHLLLRSADWCTV